MATEETVSITIRVPATVAARINKKLEGNQKPPRQDPKTKAIIIEPVYPNGIEDWVRQMVGTHIGSMIGAEDADIQSLQDQIAALREQALKKFEPEVEVAAAK